ncbi:MAG: hypothetical protein ACYSUY_20740, partial [Planctomycetota bacterium]
MNDSLPNQDNLLDTTDCLEAVGVFRGWKNFLFLLIVICLLALQVLFWVVDLGLVKADVQSADATQADALAPDADDDASTDTEMIETIPIIVDDDTNDIRQAAKEVAADSNTADEQKPPKKRLIPAMNFKHLALLVRLLNFIIIPATVLYCLTMLFSLKISLLGRLGGINHISRAFFLSLLIFVLILPWQRFFFFTDLFSGALYTAAELPAWIK